MIQNPSIELTAEEEATLMYQSIANNRETGKRLHDSIENLVEMCDTLDDQFLAMGIKHRISKILLCLTTSEVTPTRMIMIRRFFNLDTRVSLILLRLFRDQHANMPTPPQAG